MLLPGKRYRNKNGNVTGELEIIVDGVGYGYKCPDTGYRYTPYGKQYISEYYPTCDAFDLIPTPIEEESK